ncbi:receptor-binding cancer antigen expressed on SiSo cells [Odontomachus brunneus]|uniref:receptor-binding cancer antigen expressed on SiSo cells n=1 Tax=Odontomachus brunneus TaxID=486640 RepID=UPI0013F20C8F|nr:receptor-binding cancer antigen expressed on SiSo cells [Odontomachus brunneus]
MAMEFLMNWLKALLVLLFGIFRKAISCFLRRRRSSYNSVPPLSNISVIPTILSNSKTLEDWDNWEDNPTVVVLDKQVNILQTNIDQFRHQPNMTETIPEITSEINPETFPETPTEEQFNFFEDMTPKITRQTKLLIKNKPMDGLSRNTVKFIAMDPVPTNELGEWEENATGWEVDTLEEFGDPTKALREQKRKEREQRLIEQQQKRMDRMTKLSVLGTKVCS